MGSLGFINEQQTSIYGILPSRAWLIYIGPSSNIPFISRVLAIVSPPPQTQLMQPPPPHTIPSKVNPYILPPRQQVIALLDLYFSRCHKIFPYLDQEQFYEEYKLAERRGFDGIRRSWLALLNIVLAMALQLDGVDYETSERFRMAEEFYLRA